MKNTIIWILFIISFLTNVVYAFHLWENKKHTDEFFSLFTVKKTSYSDGFLDFKENLNSMNNKKPYHLIHIWDTTGLEFDTKIPYIIAIDSIFNSKKSTKINCILMSSMCDETIENCLNTRKIHFKSFIMMNSMENFISGVCNQYKRKSKPSSATLLINQKGDILYYNDKLIYTLDKDTVLQNALKSIR